MPLSGLRAVKPRPLRPMLRVGRNVGSRQSRVGFLQQAQSLTDECAADSREAESSLGAAVTSDASHAAALALRQKPTLPGAGELPRSGHSHISGQTSFQPDVEISPVSVHAIPPAGKNGGLRGSLGCLERCALQPQKNSVGRLRTQLCQTGLQFIASKGFGQPPQVWRNAFAFCVTRNDEDLNFWPVRPDHPREIGAVNSGH
jgi:hypothetical protein